MLLRRNFDMQLELKSEIAVDVCHNCPKKNQNCPKFLRVTQILDGPDGRAVPPQTPYFLRHWVKLMVI